MVSVRGEISEYHSPHTLQEQRSGVRFLRQRIERDEYDGPADGRRNLQATNAVHPAKRARSHGSQHRKGSPSVECCPDPCHGGRDLPGRDNGQGMQKEELQEESNSKETQFDSDWLAGVGLYDDNDEQSNSNYDPDGNAARIRPR